MTVVVGLDGLTVQQNRTRLWGQTPEVHYAVVANLNRLVKAGLRTAVSLTLTPYNLNSLEKIVEKLEVMGVKEIGFNFLKNAQSIPELDSPEKLDQFWKRSAEVAFRVGKKFFPHVSEFQYQKKLAAWENKDFFPLDCTCLGNQIVVQGDGYLSNCPFRHRDGVGPDAIALAAEDNLGWLGEFRQAHPLWNPAYAEIAEKALCGQGCNMGGALAIDKSSYYYSKEAFYDFLWNGKRNR